MNYKRFLAFAIVDGIGSLIRSLCRFIDSFHQSYLLAISSHSKRFVFNCLRALVDRSKLSSLLPVNSNFLSMSSFSHQVAQVDSEGLKSNSRIQFEGSHTLYIDVPSQPVLYQEFGSY